MGMLLPPRRRRLLLLLVQLVARVAGGGDEDCAADSAADKYDRSSFVADGPTGARNLDSFLGAPQRTALDSLPSAEELEQDRAWVDRRYQASGRGKPRRSGAHVLRTKLLTPDF